MDERLKPAAIYIQGLPSTVGNIQVEDICKRAGKIKKIKVYRDAGGVPKGDALVVFEAKRDRDVAADAVAMLDDMDVDQGGLGSYTISVSEAQFAAPRRAPRDREEKPQSQRELAAAAAKAWGKDIDAPAVPITDFRAPTDCPKALIANVFETTKRERDAAIETEFGRECMRFGRVLDAECVLQGPDAGALLISFVAVDAARKCCVAMHGRTFDGRGLRCELWPTGSRPERRDPSPSPSVSRRVDPSPSPTREAPPSSVVSAPPQPASQGRSGAALTVQELAYIDRVARTAPQRPPQHAQQAARVAGVGPPPPARQRRSFSSKPPASAAPTGRGRGSTLPAWMTRADAPAPLAPSSSSGRGVDNRPAWMTKPDRPGAPPPRTGEPPKAYVEPPASAPTRRVREGSAAPAAGPMSIQGFIKATGHAAPGDASAPEPKRAKRGRTGAADFF